MDEHVHSAITRGLRRAGVDVITAREDGHDATNDAVILDRATELARVVFTYDEDFLRIAAAHQRAGRFFEGVIYARSRQISIGKVVDDLAILASLGDPADFQERVTRLPL